MKTSAEDSDDSYWHAFVDRCQLRLLPEALRRQLQRVRNPYHRQDPLALITGRVDEMAAEMGVMRETGDPVLGGRRYIPAIHLRRIHRRLMGDRTVVGHLKNVVDDRLESANRERHLDVGSYPNTLPLCQPPTSGTWFVRSDLGFRLASAFESKPEGLSVGIAQRAWARSVEETFGAEDDVGIDDGVHLRVLDYGSWAGTTTHTLVATKPDYGTVNVYESDSIGETTDSPFAVAAEEAPGDDTAPFDLIVVALPPPGRDGEYQYRNRYKTSEAQRRAFDFGNVGPKRWRSGLAHILHQLPGLLAEGGEMVLLLPESVRVERGYEPAPALLDGLRELLGEHGLLVSQDVEVVETHPVAQPFVGTNRPARRCLIASRSTRTSAEGTG